MTPWNLIITAVATQSPMLIGELMALYNQHLTGTPVTAEQWTAFEGKFLALSGEQRLLAIARATQPTPT